MSVFKMFCKRCKKNFVSVNKESGCLVCGTAVTKLLGEKTEEKQIIKEWYFKK